MAAMTAACAFCLSTGELLEGQILLKGTHLYLCAPRGQVIEGCLIIAPFACVGCFAHVPAAHLEELAALQALVRRYYAGAYGVERAAFYEQGRAGGGSLTDPLGGFPHHAHLCCLPADVDLHLLLREYVSVPVRGHVDVAEAARGRPYAYVDAAGRRAVYLPRTAADRRALEQLRLTPRIAALLGLPGRGDWRRSPVEAVLERVADPFHQAFEGAT
jgi:hypothetical protein